MVIEKSKLLLGLTDNTEDALLELYREIAEEELSTVTNTFPPNLVAQMVVVKYQKKGIESVSSAQYSESRETFFLDYPTPIVNQIKALQRQNRKLKSL